MNEIFKEIYDKKKWYNYSGSGSLAENTMGYRELLKKYITEHDIKSVLDIGCGNWEFSKLIDWGEVNYLGIDIVESVIENNNKQWGKQNIKFMCVDSLDCPLPKTDLVIVKDVAQHWSNKNILNLLQKLKDFKHVIITNTCEGEGINSDIFDGNMRPVDLMREPFNQKAKELLRYESKRVTKGDWEIKSVLELLK